MSDIETEKLEVLRSIDAKLSVIRQLIELQTHSIVKDKLEKVASTPSRKIIWALCDGTLSVSDIAKKAGVSTRAVQYFVREAQELELITVDKRGFPRRTINWIPLKWQHIIKKLQQQKGSNKLRMMRNVE